MSDMVFYPWQMLTQLSLPKVLAADDDPQELINAMLRLGDKLLLVGTGHRNGRLYGLLVEAAHVGRLLVARVEPWPCLSVSCSLDRGCKWFQLSDPASTCLLEKLSQHYGDALVALDVEKPKGPVPRWARCPNFGGRRVLHREHLIRFMSLMPFKVRARADAERGRLVLFRLYARCPRSEDLYEHDPMLTHLLAVHWSIRGERQANWGAVSHLLQRDRRMLLAFVGLRPTQTMRRVLNRVNEWFGSIDQAPAVVVLLNTPGYADAVRRDPWVANWRYGMLDIIARNSDVAEALVGTYYAPRVWASDAFRETLSDAIKLADRFGNAGDFLDLQRVGDEWLIAPEVLSTVELPEPPWAGTETIVPLRTLAEVRQEGEEMQNCLKQSGRLLMAAHGQLHVYRVLAPARGTLALMQDGERYEIEGPLGKGNQRLPDEVTKAVRGQVHIPADPRRLVG